MAQRRNRQSPGWAVAVAAVVLLSGDGPGAAAQTPPNFRLSVNVDLVMVHATVRDRKGAFVGDLREADFTVYEDGVEQPLKLFQREDAPVTLGLVVDHSGSMGSKLSTVVAAARSLVQASRQDDEVFVINFNEKVTLGLAPAVRYGRQPEESARAIATAPAKGKTALYDAIAAGLTRAGKGRWEKRILIVFSDGGDNASAHTLAEVLTQAELSSTLIYTIGVFEQDDRDRNPGVLRRLARATGGEAFLPELNAEVIEIGARIAREIRSQYALGYVPARPAAAGAYRKIRVNARAKGHGRLTVRARTGYLAAGAAPPETVQ